MKLAILLAFAWCASAATHVHDKPTTNDGTTTFPPGSKIFVRGPTGGPFQTTSQTITVAADGSVDFYLQGCPGCTYTARYQFVNARGVAIPSPADERWAVGDTTVVQTLKMIQGGSMVPAGLINAQQINPAGLTAGQTWVWDGARWVGATNAAGGAGVADPGANGVMRRTGLNTTAVVTGTSTDCIRVDGSSGPCVGVADPGASGVMKRISFNTTGPVTGNATDCVLVNGTSGPCGTGGGTTTGISGTSTWSQIEAGTSAPGTIVGTTTWATIEM